MAKGEDSQNMAQQSKKKRPEEDTMSPDVGQKPIQLQRRRVWRACESCRRKKIKCDGCEPTCSQCTASGSQCTWLQTKDRAALSRHYVQELEARLLHMESLFTQIAPVLEQLGPSLNGTAPSGSSNPVPTLTPEDASAVAAILRPPVSKDRASEPPTPIKIEDDVSESLGQLALDEYGHMRWIGGSSTMSLIQSFRALTSSPLRRISPMEEDPHAPGPSVNKLYFPASVFFGKVQALPGPEEVEYPERDLADKLVEAYFSRVHFLMPVIDKPSFLQKYRQVMDIKNDPVLARAEAPFLSLVFSVFACAAHLVQDPRISTERADDGGMGMVYYERALILQYISHANIQIAHVQCFILMSSFLCSVNCLPQAWILLGQAVRTGQDLGLHRSPRRLLVSPIEKETRRKVWWGVYVLDRMLALALGRPLGINDFDCDVERPVDVDDDHLPEYFAGATLNQRRPSLMTGSNALISLYEIGGRVLRQVYGLEIFKDQLEPERKADLQRVVESLDNELTKWCDDLPIVFKSQSETEEQVSMGAVLCSHYYSVLTTLHRNLLPLRRDQPMTAKSTVKAVSSARSCIRLAPSMKHVVPPSHHLAFFIQHLFSSAVILLLYAMHAPDPRAASAAMDEAKSSFNALESWEGTWPGARKCKELLLDLTNTATEAIAKHRAEGTSASAVASTATRPTPPPPATERRRSVTIATSSSAAAPSGRVTKGRTRRTQSRDTNTSRRLAASPYRAAERARSTSRRRGLDDGEAPDRSSMASYYRTFSSTGSGQTGNSPHSSPASAHLPSPPMPVQENPPASPNMATMSPYTYASPISPVQSTHPPFDYGLQPGTSSQSSSQPWNGHNDEHRETDLYSAGSSDPQLYSSTYGYPSSLDGTYTAFEGTSDLTMSGLSTTPPGAGFAATGLPFRGLDYIRNFNLGGYSAGEQDSLWQSYDPGAFGYDPDLPFTLGESSLELQDITHQS